MEGSTSLENGRKYDVHVEPTVGDTGNIGTLWEHLLTNYGSEQPDVGTYTDENEI